MPRYSYVPKQNVAFSYPLLQMRLSSMRFVAQQNNILCCAWFLFNDGLCVAAKNAEGQLSTDENVRPLSGCITSTKEVKQYLSGKQGEQQAGPGKGLSREELGVSNGGTEAASVGSQHLQNPANTRPPHKPTSKKQCVPVM